MRIVHQLRRVSAAAAILVATTLAATASAHAQQDILRVGHFPNITHVQALVAHGLSRKGESWFEQRLGPGVRLEWYVYFRMICF
jgi:NitT/TauT family transport system substrate-binding protein